MNTILIAVVSMGAIGVFFAGFLAFASKKFAIEEDPRIEAIIEALPGANCGGCGFPGCSSFAAALVAGEAKFTGCPVGDGDVCVKIAEILGMDDTDISVEKLVAKVICGGDNGNCENKYRYVGVEDCAAAAKMAGGPKGCQYGCMGFGSCAKVCPTNAIIITDGGIAVVDEEKCIGCQKCVAACPKNIIKMVPYSSEVHVLCSSPEPGKVVRKVCKAGCIACKKCEKVCNFDAIHVENNLAVVDYDKCTGCMECVKACPVKCIEGDMEKVTVAV
ncbi:MAG: RnfABCDGE type electron transport complex subunit B [Clostridia bacterium]|jgi:electron transport complex protein RnfB|nr:RnfABCDGE type electron transport complex subunit B [Clostridiales bacterium]